MLPSFFSEKSAILKFAYSEKDCDALRGLKMDRVFGFKKELNGASNAELVSALSTMNHEKC